MSGSGGPKGPPPERSGAPLDRSPPAAVHDFVRRRHASRYFSEVLAATSGGSSGPGAVLSQSSVSR